MNKQFLFLALSTVLGATSVQAADTGFYIGGSLGQSKVSDFSGSDIDAANASEGITSSSSSDDKDTGWKAFAGYRVMKYLAIEGAYTNFGEATANGIVTAPAAFTFDSKFEAESWSLSALGILPLNEQFSLFARLGVNVWDADYSVSAPGFVSISDSEDGTDVVYGLGAAYNITKNLNLRGEWERYDLGGQDVDLLSLGVAWVF